VARALASIGESGVRIDADADVREVAGWGLALRREGREWRLGEPSWVAAEKRRVGPEGGAPIVQGDLAFGVDGRVLTTLVTREQLRADAAREVRALTEDGYEVFVLSGDSAERVAEVADSCRVPRWRAFAARSAQEKREIVHRLDHEDTLFIGDGINDSLAISEAFCGGTPAIDRPFMAAKSDFYFVTPGLSPIRAALRGSKALRRTVRLNLAVAIAYNVVAVSLAVAGRMSPLVCAIVMPLSSLSSVAATTLSLSRSRLWM
jgi:Cu2+-exporting ATPase